MSDTGWLNPAVVTTDNSIGSIDWTDPENADAEDAAYANVLLADSENSYYLMANEYNADIPEGTVPVGIEVRVVRHADSVDVIRDSRLYVGLAAGDSSNLSDAAYWPTSDAAQLYGGAADLCGLTPTRDDVNNSTFGVWLQVVADGGAGVTANVDSMQVRITFEEAVAANTTNFFQFI